MKILKDKGPKNDPYGIPVIPSAKRTTTLSSLFTII